MLYPLYATMLKKRLKGKSAVVIKILVDNVTQSALQAEWGLAVYIEYRGHKLLLDTGASGRFIDNAAAMGIDLGQVEFGVLSHAHYDHADGMKAFFQHNASAPFYLRRGAQENCYKKDGLFPKYIGIHKGYLSQFQDRIIFADGDFQVIPGLWLIPHKTPGLDKIGKTAHMYVKKNWRLRPDSFDHEQSLVLDTQQGLVIFNSCSHGGADNIIREVAGTFPGKHIHALIGGLHLFASPDEDILALARRVSETGIDKVYTGHCTGAHAMELLCQELGDRVEQIYTGMEIL